MVGSGVKSAASSVELSNAVENSKAPGQRLDAEASKKGRKIRELQGRTKAAAEEYDEIDKIKTPSEAVQYFDKPEKSKKR